MRDEQGASQGASTEGGGVSAGATPVLGDPLDPLASVEARRERDLVRARLFGEAPEPLRIGRFVPLRRLGAGGMGVVYLAYDEQLDRKVALKLLREAAGGSARLLREAQAMARLAHPNVAAIYEVGEAEGRVFLAMELVEGQTLRAWMEGRRGARAARGAYREALALLVGAGRGLAAAHAVGLVHRDFKPENVMVGDDGRARVLDFGLARPALEPAAAEAAGEAGDGGAAAAVTAPGVIAGTPAYMAPEQRAGAEVDARADQFSFCVTLYEALYGEHPFGAATAAELAARVAAGEVTPPPRGAEVPPWLGAIALRGLRPRPEDRWPSMDALLAALARDPARSRRRLAEIGAGALLAAAAAAAALTLGDRGAGACAGGRALVEESFGAARRAAVARALEAAGPSFAAASSRALGALDARAAAWERMHAEACLAHRRGEQSAALLDRRMACLDRRRSELGALAAALAEGDREVLARAADAADRLEPIERCADLEALGAEAPPPADPAARARAAALRDRLAVARAEGIAGRYARALAEADAVLAEARPLGHAPLTAEAELRRGWLLKELGRYEDAAAALAEAFQRALAARADEIAAEAASQAMLVIGYHQGRFEQAAPWERAAAALAERLGAGRQLEADLLNNRGLIRQEQGRLDEARADFERSLGLLEALHGPDAPALTRVLSNLSRVSYARGEQAEAAARLERALRIRERAFGAEHPDVAAALSNLSLVQVAQGRLDDAVAGLRRALDIQARAFGEAHPSLAQASNNLGNAVFEQGRHEDALALYERAERNLRGQERPNPLQLALFLSNEGGALIKLGRHREAEERIRRALELRRERLGPEHADIGTTQHNLGDALAGQGRRVEASGCYREALRIFEQALGKEHLHVAYPLLGLGRAALLGDEQGRGKDAARAAALLERAVGILEARGGSAGERSEARALLAEARRGR